VETERVAALTAPKTARDASAKLRAEENMISNFYLEVR
jgi:hypothetical protein